MKSIEVIKDTFDLSNKVARLISQELLPKEELITQINPNMQSWLKAKAKETNTEFLAVSVIKNTLHSSILRIFVRVDLNTVQILSFNFTGQHPLDELWRASVSSGFEDKLAHDYFAFKPHKRN